MIAIAAIAAIGGFTTLFEPQFPQPTPPPPGYKSTIIDDVSQDKDKNLQLKSFKVVVSKCTSQNKVAVDLLLDSSGSMGEASQPRNNKYREGDPRRGPSKLDKLKEAVILFFNDYLQDDDVIGVQDYSADSRKQNARITLDFTTKAQAKGVFSSKINALDDRGQTPMRDAFILAKSEIEKYYPQYKDRQWILIFFTDGKPVPSGPPPNGQDPNDIVEQLKATFSNSELRIITVGLGSVNERLLRFIASDPKESNYLYAPDGEKLKEIYESIGKSLCNDVPPIITVTKGPTVTPSSTPTPTNSPTPTATPTPPPL